MALDPLQQDQMNQPGPGLVTPTDNGMTSLVPLPTLKQKGNQPQPAAAPAAKPEEPQSADLAPDGSQWAGPIVESAPDGADLAPDGSQWAEPIQDGPPKTFLENVRDAVMGPTTAFGQGPPQAAKDEAEGWGDVFKGDVGQGLGKIWEANRPHVTKGSAIEKIMKTFYPDFEGAGIPEERATALPVIDVAQFIDKQEHPIVKAIAETAQSFTSPENVAIMIATGGLGMISKGAKGLELAGRLLSAGFSAGAIGSAYKNVEAFKDAYDKGDTSEAMYQMTHALTSGTIAALAAKHAEPVNLAKDLGGAAKAGVKQAMFGAPETAEGLVGKIAQASPEDIPTARRGLAATDTKDVKTYADLKSKLDTQVRENIKNVDTDLSLTTDMLKPKDTESVVKVQGRPDIVSNHVIDALDQLSDFYDKTNQPAELARMQELYTKFEDRGLSLKEVNDLAREHGTELSAYNASGELASGLKKQAAENTRIGVKELVRRSMKDDATRELDTQTSDLIKTRDMVDDMGSRVQDFKNKMSKAGFMERMTTGALHVIDTLSMHSLKGVAKGALKSILKDGTLNPLEIEKTLSKNLKLLDELEAMTPQQAAKALNAMGSGQGAKQPMPNAIPSLREDMDASIEGSVKSMSLRQQIEDLGEKFPEMRKRLEEELVQQEQANRDMFSKMPGEQGGYLERTADEAGLEYRGSDDLGLSHFHDNETNHTFSVVTDKVTPELLAEKRAVKPPPATGEGSLSEFNQGMEAKQKSPVQEAKSTLRDLKKELKDTKQKMRDINTFDSSPYADADAQARYKTRQELRARVYDLADKVAEATNNLRQETYRQREMDADAPAQTKKTTVPEHAERIKEATERFNDLAAKHVESLAKAEELVPKEGEPVNAERLFRQRQAAREASKIGSQLHEAEAERVYLENFKPEIEGDVPHIAVNKADFTINHPEKVVGHEYGHIGSEVLYGRGLKGRAVFSNKHADTPSKSTAAWAFMQYGDLLNKDGTVREGMKHTSEDAAAMMKMMASGGAIEQLLDGKKWRDNNSIRGDKSIMAGLLRRMQVPRFMWDGIIDKMYEEAIKDWNHPDILDTVKKYRSGREANLPDTMHVSRSRIEAFNAELKAAMEKRDGNTEGTGTSGPEIGGLSTEPTGEVRGVGRSDEGRGPNEDAGGLSNSDVGSAEGASASEKELIPEAKARQKQAVDTTEVEPKGSTVALRTNPLKVKGSGDAGKIMTTDVARALNKFTKKEIPALKLGKAEPEEMVRRAEEIGEEEAKYQLTQNNTGTEWYTSEMKEHDTYMARMRNELTDPIKSSIFKFAEAILSSGQKPYRNAKATIQAWDHYQKTGQFSPFNPVTGKSWGPRSVVAYGGAFESLNRLIKEKGEQGASEFLLGDHTVAELRDYKPDLGGKKTDVVPGALLLGPKRGPFALNLHGREAAFTADMWVTRTWNRWMGTMEFDPKTGEELTAAPRNPGERLLMEKSFSNVAKKLDLSTSALQAVLWYYEQALYDVHGSKKESWSFSNAAKRLYEEHQAETAKANPVDAGKLALAGAKK